MERAATGYKLRHGRPKQFPKKAKWEKIDTQSDSVGKKNQKAKKQDENERKLLINHTNFKHFYLDVECTPSVKGIRPDHSRAKVY